MRKFDLPYLLWELMVKNGLTIKYEDADISINANNIDYDFLMFVLSNVIYSDLFQKESLIQVDKKDYREFESSKYKIIENRSLMNEEFSETFYELLENNPEIKQNLELHDVLNKIAGYMLDSKYTEYTKEEISEYTDSKAMSNFDLLISMIELESRKNENNSRIANDAIRMIDVCSENDISSAEDVLRLYYESKNNEEDSEYIKRNKLREVYSSISFLITRVNSIMMDVKTYMERTPKKRLSI